MAYLEYIDDDEYERFKRKQREDRERQKSAAASRVDDTWRKAQRSESAPDLALSGPRTSYEPAITVNVPSGGLTARYDAPAYYEPTPRVSDADVAESAVRMGVDPWQVAQEQARQNRPGDEGIRQTLAAPVRFVGQNISKPIAGLGAEIGRLGWEGMEKATDTGSGLATELLGGRPQEQYESLLGLSRSDIPDIAERQKKRREQGLAYMPVGEFLPMTASEVGTIARGLQAGLKAVPRETMAAASILKEGFQTAAPVASKAGRVLGDVTTSPEVRRLTPGGTVAEAAEGTKRYYHGTGSTFESPDAAKFDANGLYGPGYYLTDSPEVAGSYATNRASDIDRWSRKMSQSEAQDIVRQINSHWVQPTTLKPEEIAGRPFDLVASELVNRLGREKSLGFNNAVNIINDSFPDFIGGQQVRAVSVPENLRLLDAEAPVPKELVQSLEQRFSTFNDRGLTGDRFDEALSMLPDNPTGHDLYKALYWTGERDSEWLQIQLQSLGYDGIRYQGGKRRPMRGPDGNPIEHEAIVIFPESLPKITNALSGKPMGVAPETVGAVGGAVQGASTVEEGDSPEEAARKVMTSAAIGGLGIAGVMRGAKALPGAARRIVPRLGVEDVGRGLPDLDEALAAIRNAPTAEELVNLRKGTMSRYPPTSAEGKAILGAAQARFGQLSGELPERQIGRVGDESAAIGGVADVRSTQTIGAQVDTLPQTTGQLESTRQMAEAPRTIEGIAGTPPPQEPPTSGVDASPFLPGKRPATEPISAERAQAGQISSQSSTNLQAEAVETIADTSALSGPPEPPIKIGDTTILPPPDGKPPIEITVNEPKGRVVFRQFWDRARNVIASQGEAGKQLAAMLQQARDRAETMAGQWVLDMPAVRKLNKDEFINFVDVVEGNRNPANKRVTQAAGEWGKVRDDIYAMAQLAGLDTGHLEDYFPHRYDPAMFKGDKFMEAIKHLVDTGQAKDQTEAAMMLRYRNDVLRNRRAGNLEIPRIVDLPGYEKTKDSLFGYVESAANRISQVSVLGMEDSKAQALITELGNAGYDASAVKNLFDISVGAKKYGDYQQEMSRLGRAYSSWTKLGLGALTNVGQSVNTATVVGGLRTIMNAKKALVNADAQDFALKAGVTLDGVIKDLREGSGFAGKSGAYGAPGFSAVEKFNRALAAIAGRDYARAMAKRAAQGEQNIAGRAFDWVTQQVSRESATKALKQMGIDPQVVITRKGRLNEAEEIKAARNIVERTQFKVDPQDLPGWAASPWGKLVMQFRTFGYNQTAFVGNEVIRPARRGNIKPLIRFLIYGGLVGTAEQEAQDFLRQRPREEDFGAYVRHSYERVGGLGLLGDLMRAVAPPNSRYLPGERYALQAASFVAGPTAGTALEAIGSVPSALQGKPENLGRFVVKQVPIVGPTAKNIVLPYKPGGRGNKPDDGDDRVNLYIKSLRESGASKPNYLKR